jgi:hypothetical protein
MFPMSERAAPLTTMEPPASEQPASSPRKRRRPLRIIGAVLGGLVLLPIGIVIGSAGKTTPAAIVHTRTVTKTVTVKVPGPAVTKTVTVPAPPPPVGSVIGNWSGTGNQVTPAFNAPASGDYIVSWSYSGNVNPTIGGGTNFAITATDSSAEGLGLPNDIAASGSGSTEITGASGVESFNVQAAGQWTIKVVSGIVRTLIITLALALCGVLGLAACGGMSAAAGHRLVSRPSSYPSGQAGIDAP